MHLLLTLFLIWLKIYKVTAEFNEGNCHLQNFSDFQWFLGSYSIPSPINDTYTGTVFELESYNITEILNLEENYLSAKLKLNKLEVFTTEAFKKFEEEVHGKSQGDVISVDIKFLCQNEQPRKMKFQVEVKDINNHVPVFSKSEYIYNIAMNIPENFEFTKLLPISTYDIDFTNRRMQYRFEAEDTQNFKINKIARQNYGDYKNYFTKLTALRNLTMPFREELTIVAIDDGTPQTNQTAKVIIDLKSFQKAEQAVSHVINFTKSVYYANYTNEAALLFTENVQLQGNFTSHTVRVMQSGYENSFQLLYDESSKEVEIKVIEPLGQDDLQNNFIVLELRAELKNSQISDHTNVLIYLKTGENNHGDFNQNCGASGAFLNINSVYKLTMPTTLFLGVLLIIVIINVIFILKVENFKKLTIIKPESEKAP